MTVVEKKKLINKTIDSILEANLGEVLLKVQELASKEETRKKILLTLIKNEKNLFEKLAK